LTVIDPSQHRVDPNETRVMGRININTAPWFVLAQLPWIRYEPTDPDTTTFVRAQKIVEHRDNAARPYKSTAELMQIDALRQLAVDGVHNLYDDSVSDPNAGRGPDLTRDMALDDLEERDILFTRLSDLVTVRSDVFTAYILVRIGLDGPQKRVIAILDRSATDIDNPAVRIVAIHPVPDPR